MKDLKYVQIQLETQRFPALPMQLYKGETEDQASIVEEISPQLQAILQESRRRCHQPHYTL